MKDTIDLLETIGRDATLRHAPPQEITRLLAQAQASAALLAAAASGDGSALWAEFGQPTNETPQVSQMPAQEEEDSEEEEQAEPLVLPPSGG